ncbi:MAG: hypothetical protein V7603_3997 [Micromonosporaceae bacterium]
MVDTAVARMRVAMSIATGRRRNVRYSGYEPAATRSLRDTRR